MLEHAARLRDRFRGALLGTAVGDALGAPFEGRQTVDPAALERWSAADDQLRWTDDTHMAIGVAESLVQVGGFDGAQMAGRFAANYDAEPWRGYGAGPPRVFAALRGGARWDHRATAERNGAPAPVVDVLRSLPDRRFRHVRDLWNEVPEVPVGT